MNPFGKIRLFFFFSFLLAILFFQKQSLADWGNETIPPTAKVTINCGSDTPIIATESASIDCGTTSATITFDYAKPDTGTGLQLLTRLISGGTVTEVGPTPTPISGCAYSGAISTGTGSAVICDKIPPVRSASFAYTVTNATPSFTVSADATDWAGNIGKAASSSSSFTLNFVKYSIQGAVYVDTNKNTTKDTGEIPYALSPSTIEVHVANSSLCNGALVTSVGSGGTITTADGTYNTGPNLYSGWYDICYTSLPVPEYSATLPQGRVRPAALPSRTVRVGPTSATDINFGITNSTTWFQGVGGDMRLDGGFTDKLPSGKYASLPAVTGGSPGIIFSGDVGDTTPTYFGLGSPSERSQLLPYNWYAGGSAYPEKATPNFIKTSYNYLLATATQNNITPIVIPDTSSTYCGSGGRTNCVLSSSLSNGVYKAEGDLKITNSSYTFPNGKNFVILVAGDLTINGEIKVPNGSTVTFSAARDIIIDKDVGAPILTPSTSCIISTALNGTSTGCQVEGLFSADRNIVIQGTNNCTVSADKRLNISGALVANAGLSAAGTFRNLRDLCGNSTSYPALYIVERVDFILNAPSFIKRTPSIWRELPPGRLASTVDPTPTPTVTPTPTITPTPTPTSTPTPTPTPILTPTPTPTPIPNLAAWWKFDEGSGATTADSSVNTNTGTLTNGPAWTTGRIGGALSFDGVDDSVDAGNGASLNLTGSFTITAWIKPVTFGGGNKGRIVEKSNWVNGYSFAVNNDASATNGLLLFINNVCSNCFVFSSSNIISLNTWQHVAAVYNSSGGAVNFYVNGVSAGSGFFTAPPNSNSSVFYIGKGASRTDRQFNGVIDDLRVYNTALSQTAIQNIYNGL